MSVSHTSIHITKPGTATAKNEVRRTEPAFHPGGTPRVTSGSVNVDVEVTMKPAEFVTTKVTSVGDGVRAGSAVALNMLCSPIMGWYVLVARPDVTIPLAAWLTEVLNAYAGVVYVGVARGKFGNVVATVAERDERTDARESGVSGVSVLLCNE